MSKRGVVEEEIEEAEANGNGAILDHGQPMPIVTNGDCTRVELVPPCRNLVPKAAEITARLEAIDRERRTLRKLLKIAKEAEA